MNKVLLSVVAFLSLTYVIGQKPVSKLVESDSNESGRSLNYTFSSHTGAYVNLSSPVSLNIGVIWDDPEYIVPVSFPFKINGHTITSLEFVGLGTDMDGITAGGDTIELVIPFGADLIDRGSNSGISVSPISYKVEGSVGSRILKIEWQNAGSYGDNDLTMFVNVQLWLHETTNLIEVRFGPNMINNPVFFYEGETGAYIGVATYISSSETVDNIHLISGPIAAPVLVQSNTALIGTPSNGTIYRLTPITIASLSSDEFTTMNIYPNPSAGIFNITLPEGKIFSIDVIDNSGRVLSSQNSVAVQATLDLSENTSGVYMVRITDTLGNVSFGRVVKK